MHRTLPRRFYADPDFYRRELERFYFTRWICAGRADQIPDAGDYFTRSIADENVIVTRDTAGGIHAFFNLCRHRGTRLTEQSEGHFVERIQCPYHAWTYDLSGRLLAAQHMPPDFRKDDFPLHRAGCDVWDGHIFLFLDAVSVAPSLLDADSDGVLRARGELVEPRARARPSTSSGRALPTSVASLRDQLGDLPQRFAGYRMQDLRLARRITYDVKANWKLIVLNYNECLHCPNLHPALNRLHHYLAAENVAPTSSYCGGSMGFREGVETMSTDGRRRRECLPGLSGQQRQQVSYFTIYPNLLLSLHPDYMMTHTMWPRAHDRTEIVCEWYFHPTELAKADFDAEDAISFWDATNREDWWISEQSQAGISSRVYEPGPYSEREELLWSFDDIVRRETEDLDRS